jgi:SET family sugar efflux transporter-like MFS transporter
MHLAILPVFLKIGTGAGALGRAGATDGPDPVVGAARPSRARLLRISCAFILMQCAASLGVTSLSLFVSEDLHGKVSDAGLVLGLCAAIEIPLMLLFGALAARWSLRRLVLLGAATGVAYFAAMVAAAGLWQVMVGQLLNACFIATVGGLGISYFQDLLPGLPGRATTMFTNAQRLSAMLAGLVFGVVQVAGYRSAYLIGAGLCASGLLLLASDRSRRTPGVARVASIMDQ